MEMLLTGQPISAATALAWGLVNRVVPADQLDQEIAKFTDLIGARSAATVAIGKRTFYQQLDGGLEAAYQIAGEAMTCNMGYPDASEGIDAFLGKRMPAWRGK
jgi:enoyl-CoA hydratase/carnithine racemase